MLSRDIANKLLSKFESSKAFIEGSQSRRKVELKLSEPFFDGLRNGSQDLDIALEALEREGFCEIRHQDDYLERIILKTDHASIEKAYAFAKRSNPKNRLDALKAFFTELGSSSNSLLCGFAAHCLELLSKGKPNGVESAYGEIEELRFVVLCIEKILELDGDVPERVFASHILGDSKRFATYRNKVAKILREFSDMSFDEDDDPIAFYGVIKNKTYAFVKGEGVFRFGKQTIDLAQYGHELALSDEMIEQMMVESIPAKKLFTVENLTSFIQFSQPESIVIYLGGFHNSVRRNLIRKIFNAAHGIECFHYGDIDAGGFYILNHLREKTGIPFQPYMMDAETLARFIDRTKEITKSDELRLLKMQEDPRFAEFLPALQAILKNKKKLEQEAELEF
ncbi:MAG: DUF2220 family protein [Candidatus Enteromonas sp.]|nr:DUF2220 family protein [Candidatus Enteromonas sp.]